MVYEQTIRSAGAVQRHRTALGSARLPPHPSGAASNTGIVFRRTDLDGFEMEAVGRNVARVSYATSLMKKGVLISTTEHLLSAFVGMGIDNAIVELDNLELPILDGSAQPFIDLIQACGSKKAAASKEFSAHPAFARVARGQQVHRSAIRQTATRCLTQLIFRTR